MNSYFLDGQARALCPSSRQIPQRLGLLGGTLGSSVGVVVKLVLAVIDLALEVLELVVTVVLAVFALMVVEDWHTGPRAGDIP